MVAGNPGPARRCGHDAGVRLERKPRARDPCCRNCASGTRPVRFREASVTIATIDAVPADLARGRGGGPAPKRVVVAYGFWIFILSDFVLFSGLFAAYAVLSGNTAGGPTGAELFNLRNVFIETACLLFSSYTCGLGALSAERRQPVLFLIFAALTFVLGAAFLFIEAREFAG